MKDGERRTIQNTRKQPPRGEPKNQRTPEVVYSKPEHDAEDLNKKSKIFAPLRQHQSWNVGSALATNIPLKGAWCETHSYTVRENFWSGNWETYDQEPESLEGKSVGWQKGRGGQNTGGSSIKLASWCGKACVNSNLDLVNENDVGGRLTTLTSSGTQNVGNKEVRDSSVRRGFSGKSPWWRKGMCRQRIPWVDFWRLAWPSCASGFRNWSKGQKTKQITRDIYIITTSIIQLQKFNPW